MTLLDLIHRVRQHTRDLSSSIFRERDIVAFINEAVERCQQVIPELNGMERLNEHLDRPILLPIAYQHLLATYATSRCFGQDERHYQATVFMNDFEVKMAELKTAIDSGDVVIRDEDGNIVRPEKAYEAEYVKDNYFF